MPGISLSTDESLIRWSRYGQGRRKSYKSWGQSLFDERASSWVPYRGRNGGSVSRLVRDDRRLCETNERSEMEDVGPAK
jgi:hypothetical protein